MKYLIGCSVLLIVVSAWAQEAALQPEQTLQALEKRQVELNGLMTQLQALRQELTDLQQMLNASDAQIEQKLSQIKDLEKQLQQAPN